MAYWGLKECYGFEITYRIQQIFVKLGFENCSVNLIKRQVKTREATQ